MASEARTTVHVLSKKSSSLHRDTFIFWTGRDVRLLMGLNQKTTPVTGERLQRWMRLVAPRACDFELRPVALTKHSLLLYSCTPAGPAISPLSTVPLPTGDYGWFNADGSNFVPFDTRQTPSSFTVAKGYADRATEEAAVWARKYLLNVLKFYTFPPSFEDSVMERDAQCFITGSIASPEQSNSNLRVCWIFPPAWTDNLMSGETVSHSDFVTPANAGVLRADLVDLFHDNAFGIDVDDDHRIVVFRDLGTVSLPLKMHGASVHVGPDDRFLREHFRRCLFAYAASGDIREDYDPATVAQAAEDLGLYDSDGEVAPLNDPRWQTELGRDLLEQHLNSQLHSDDLSDDD